MIEGTRYRNQVGKDETPHTSNCIKFVVRQWRKCPNRSWNTFIITWVHSGTKYNVQLNLASAALKSEERNETSLCMFEIINSNILHDATFGTLFFLILILMNGYWIWSMKTKHNIHVSKIILCSHFDHVFHSAGSFFILSRRASVCKLPYTKWYAIVVGQYRNFDVTAFPKLT